MISVFFLCFLATCSAMVFDICDYGARISDCLQTESIQKAIDAAGANGGGIVRVPEGRYRTGGLVLRSNVTLKLEDGAILEASRNPDDYPGSNRWYRGVIRADGARNVGIEGGRFSMINGMNCFDPLGEENYRGPHALLFINCTNINLSGYSIYDSGNWAHAIFHSRNVHINDVKVYGGHDACDVHDSEDVLVENCKLYTGDDGIAGFGNYRCTVRDCIIDSGCQAIRFGGNDCLFERCHTAYPPSFGHRYSLSDEEKRLAVNHGEVLQHKTIAGFLYYCDERWKITRRQENIRLKDCTFDHPGRFFRMNFDGRNQWCCNKPLVSISFENCRFLGLQMPATVYGDESDPIEMVFKNCHFAADRETSGEILTAYNFKRLVFENPTFERYVNPHIITRSKGDVVITGGVLQSRYKPDDADKIYSLEEIYSLLQKMPVDSAAWLKWQQSIPISDESLWDEQRGLYVLKSDPAKLDVWGSILAVFRGETKHQKRIAYSIRRRYGYYVGWNNKGMVATTDRGELSSLPAGAFAYTLFLHDILPARAFLTDFLRTPGKTPAETAGVKLAVQKMLKKKD